MSRFYVVPEDYIKRLLKDSKMLECLDCSDYKLIKHESGYDEMLEEKGSYINDCSELSEFGVIESSDTVVDNAIITKSVHDDIFVDKDKFITHQVSLQFNEVQQQGAVQQDMFKDKQ